MQDGESLLYEAARRGALNCATFLMQSEAIRSQLSYNGETPLMAAISFE